MRIMITGSREWTDKAFIKDILKNFDPKRDTIIHGAARGADLLAAAAARELGWPKERLIAYPAEWKRQASGWYDRDAGKKRNQEMVNTLDPANSRVLAFWLDGSGGTADAIERAERRKIKVSKFIRRTGNPDTEVVNFCTIQVDLGDLI